MTDDGSQLQVELLEERYLKWKPRIPKRWWPLFFALLLLAVISAFGFNLNQHTVLSPFAVQLGTVLLLAAAAVLIVADRRPQPRHTGLPLLWPILFAALVLLSALILGVIAAWIAIGYVVAIGIAALINWQGTLVQGIAHYLSRQRATVMYLRKAWHHAWLLDMASPFVRSESPLRVLWNYLRRVVSPRNRSFLYLMALVIGGIVAPIFMHLVANTYDPEPTFEVPEGTPWLTEALLPLTRVTADRWQLDPLQLLLIGLVSSVVLLGIAEMLYSSFGRSRYIFGEFSPLIAADPALGKVAEDIRRAIIVELQTTAGLLRQRQVENFNLSRDDSNAFFVSSGFDQEFLQQIEQIVSIDIPTGRINLAQLSLLYARATAKVFASGRVTRQSTGGLEVRVELRHWNRSPISAHARIDALVAHDAVDSSRIQDAAREIALKLLIALNQVVGVGSTWQTFDAFLKGLKAASTQHWWQAIAYYYLALDTGPSEPHDQFGVVYFHLGSALVFQGRWELGVSMLRKAEEIGPPIPELHYMLAFVMLYVYWGELGSLHAIFDQIKAHCLRAIALRPDFPEAYHLLGTANYRAGRIEDRNGSAATKATPAIKHSYTLAMHYYRRALRLYDRKMRRMANEVKGATYTGQTLLLQRMTAEHQLGDALRGLDLYFEAEQRYENMHVLFPTNIRNIADWLKTYCLAGQWKHARDVLYRSFLNVDLARWDADVLIHAGWLLAATVKQLSRDQEENGRIEVLTEATMYLDYALLMRPRYIEPWRQTKWEVESIAASPNVSKEELLDKTIGELLKDRAWYQYWVKERKRAIEAFKTGHASTPKWLPDGLLFAYRSYFDTVCQVVKHEREAIKHDRDTGLQRRFNRINAASNLFETAWKRLNLWMSDNFSQPRIKRLTGRARLIVDLYQQVTLFTARMLAEAGMYEQLAEVAGDANDGLLKFQKTWQAATQTTVGGDNRKAPAYQTLTPLVFRYGLVAVKAWYAYAILMREHDMVAQSIGAADQPADAAGYASKAVETAAARVHLEAASRLIPVHPLLVFVRAQYTAHDGLHGEAMDAMKTALGIVSPLDPKRDVGGSIAAPHPPAPTSSKERTDLYFLERVIGRQQFHNIVNPVSVHLEIARYATASGDIERSVRHLSEAVRSSPFSDAHRDILSDLAHNLSTMERYGDANAVIETLRTTHAKIGHVALSAAKQLAPDVLDAVITSRRNRAAEALVKAQAAAEKLEYVSIDMLVKRVSSQFGLPDKDFSGDFARYATSLKALITEFPAHLSDKDKYSARFARIFNEQVATAGTSLWEIQEAALKYVLEEKFGIAGKDIKLPMVFGRLVALGETPLKEAIDTLAALARLALSREALRHLIKRWKSEQNGLVRTADEMKFAHVALFLGRQARDTLIQMADLCNSLAYNRATMQNGASYYAAIDVHTAITIMLFLRELTDSDNEIYPETVRKLAQYCDTLGWVEFARQLPTPRKGLALRNREIEVNIASLLDGLRRATEYLELGVHYDPSRAIIHYHLAHVHLRAAELLQETALTGFQVGATAKAYLERAKTELEVAERNDPHGRLRDPIRDAILWYRRLIKASTQPEDGAISHVRYSV